MWLICCLSFLLTGTLVSHVTLRLLKPECSLDKSWCQEELSVAVKRAVSLLHTHTISSRVGKGEPGKGHGGSVRGGSQGVPELPVPVVLGGSSSLAVVLLVCFCSVSLSETGRPVR